MEKLDILMHKVWLLGNGSISKGDSVLADLNFDGVVDSFDLVVLRQKASK